MTFYHLHRSYAIEFFFSKSIIISGFDIDFWIDRKKTVGYALVASSLAVLNLTSLKWFVGKEVEYFRYSILEIRLKHYFVL